jgi:hypothetical protein
MATLIFRCPTTGMNVQGWFADEVAAKADKHDYVGMSCSACRRTHLVNPQTGKVVGDPHR